MKQRSLANQHLMLNAILERFDAVDVTGMSAWERARAVHGRTAAGLAEGADEARGSAVPTQKAPSASPAQLFEDAA